jgi:hypothetical protein
LIQASTIKLPIYKANLEEFWTDLRKMQEASLRFNAKAQRRRERMSENEISRIIIAKNGIYRVVNGLEEE